MDGEMKIDEETGVCNARTRLDDVLQTLMERVEAKSESEEEKEFSPDIDVGDYNIISSPKKISSVKSRKRKRKDDTPQKDSSTLHHAYVMKMFDRSVDLAQFNASTPLYPICRAWISNDPQNKVQVPQEDADKVSTPEPDTCDDSNSETRPKNVCHLPKPNALPIVNGAMKDLRIPEPLPPQKDEVSLDTYIHDEAAAPQKEVMLMNHMNRWREVRSRWKAAAHANEARFFKSAVILKTIFEQ